MNHGYGGGYLLGGQGAAALSAVDVKKAAAPSSLTSRPIFHLVLDSANSSRTCLNVERKAVDLHNAGKRLLRSAFHPFRALLVHCRPQAFRGRLVADMRPGTKEKWALGCLSVLFLLSCLGWAIGLFDLPPKPQVTRTR